MCLGRSTPRMGDKVPPLPRFPHPYTYVLAKILQNGVKFIQKLTPGFKNHMRNLDNFRQGEESQKSLNSTGYICPTHTFLQLKHKLRIYLPYFQLLVRQISCVIFETISHFSQHNSPAFLSSNITYFRQKYPTKVQIFRLSTGRI